VTVSLANSSQVTGDPELDRNEWPADSSCGDRVGDELSRLEAKSVFLVVDRQAYELSTARSELESCWRNRNLVEFEGFASNPQIENVLSGVEQFRRSPCEAMVAVGGGTALDIAKLVRFFAGQRHSPTEIIEDKNLIEQSAALSAPLIAGACAGGSELYFVCFACTSQSGRHRYGLTPAMMVLKYPCEISTSGS